MCNDWQKVRNHDDGHGYLHWKIRFRMRNWSNVCPAHVVGILQRVSDTHDAQRGNDEQEYAQQVRALLVVVLLEIGP